MIYPLKTDGFRSSTDFPYFQLDLSHKQNGKKAVFESFEK